MCLIVQFHSRNNIYRDRTWFSVFKHSLDHEKGVENKSEGCVFKPVPREPANV